MKDKEIKFVRLGIGNYYGDVNATCRIDKDGNKTYRLELDNHSGMEVKQISRNLFNALVREFGLSKKKGVGVTWNTK